LLTRWTQMAAFVPFFRNHTNIRTIDQEPWAFGKQTEAICRRFIELRYQLLPYLYCLFAESARTGAPIMRPLLWHYQNDSVAAAVSDQFLLGADLLVAPIIRQGAVARSVYLPRGDWFDFWSGEKFSGGKHVVAEAPLETIPLFTRAGAIIPMDAVQQFVGEKKAGVMNLHIWPGGNGKLDWYEDDGETMAYETGSVLKREIALKQNKLIFGKVSGDFSSQVTTWRVILRSVQRPVGITGNGNRISYKFHREARFAVFDIPNSSDAFTIQLKLKQ
jgi:alpha-glucosidase